MTKVVFFTFNAFQENTYVVYETESRAAIIFDPGCLGPDEEEELFSKIEELALNPTYLINTHCHLDHVFGNAAVAQRYGLELGIHALEAPVLAAAPAVNAAYGLPPFPTSPEAGYFLHEEDTLTLGRATFELFLTPGHSPGSLCFYNAADGYLIAGDVLFAGSVGRADLPGGDFPTLIESIRGQLLPLPDETIVYPGHGPATTIGQERYNNPFLS